MKAVKTYNDMAYKEKNHKNLSHKIFFRYGIIQLCYRIYFKKLFSLKEDLKKLVIGSLKNGKTTDGLK